ncbi:putative transcriptional regulator [Bosea sp. BE125]|uniref:helix-turn-helix domain-containing protein n=1 Tax=Bosea sp. BE125 TaxID=2817909 RepID=UPI00286147F3|nr:helix-turn-helix transcriptional regulator [Bosea sp. BE125]MDR6872908.1 putative transcriptional regulator [Bosea sp. BE125]
MRDIREWVAEQMQDTEFKREYDALEEEFALLTSLIRARTNARLTQEELAQRMGTTQSVIARLESGWGKPSTRTLERYARATGTKLRITLEAAE